MLSLVVEDSKRSAAGRNNKFSKGINRMDQNNTATTQSPITFAAIVKMFRGKAKTLIISALIAVVIGGALGAFLTVSETSYGSTVNFYLTTKDGTQALLPLLNSDSFAEKLLLDENGLPPKTECDPEDYDAALKAINEYNDAVEVKRALAKQTSVLAAEYTVKETTYNALLDEYENRYNELYMYLSAQDEIAKGENHAATIQYYEKKLEEARDALEAFTPEYLDKKTEKASNADALVKAKNDVIDKRYLAQEAAEKVLASWRQKNDVKNLVHIINDSVSYEYAKLVEGVSAGTVAESEGNQNAAFLVITVNVPKDRETAEMIVEKLKERVPYFVEDNIERLTGVNDPKCTLISTFGDVVKIGGSGLIKAVITYALIAAVLVVVVAAFIIVVKGVLPPDVFEKKEKNKKNKEANKA